MRVQSALRAIPLALLLAASSDALAQAEPLPANAHLESSTGDWQCKRGFRKVDEACTPLAVPEHAFLNDRGNGW